MKRLIAFLLCALPCLAALPAATVWEVEIGASDSNAGCFDPGVAVPGTDYSKQSSAQYSFSDLAVTAGNNAIVSSASHNFVAADNGDCLFISTSTGGWTAGRYVITTTSGNNATLDRSPAAVNTTGGTWVEGGSLLTPGQADSLKVASNVTFLLYSATPYGITTATPGSGGPIASATLGVIQTYATTRSVGNSDANRATIQTQAATITAITGAGAIIEGVIFDGNSQTASKFISASATLYKVTAKNFNTASSGTPVWVDSYITANSAAVLTGYCTYCEVASNTATASNAVMCAFCIFHDNSGAATDGHSSLVSTVLINVSAYNNGRDGFNSASAANFLGINMDSESNGRYGYGFTAGAAPRVLDFYSGISNGMTLTDTAVGTLSLSNFLSISGSAFTAAGSGNFALNATSGAGAVLRNAALPSLFPSGTTATYQDVGAARHQDPSGGSVTVGYFQ